MTYSENYREIPAFLPKTVLQRGAKGRSVKILQQALLAEFLKGRISTPPFNPKLSWKSGVNTDELEKPRLIYRKKSDSYGYFGEQTEKSLLEHTGTTKVSKEVWQALGLKVGESLEDMFLLPEYTGDYLNVAVKKNNVTINYQPKIYVVLYDNIVAKENYIKLALEGIAGWSGKDIPIQGVSANFNVKLIDSFGAPWDQRRDNLEGFLENRKSHANFIIHAGRPAQSMALKSVFWRRSSNIRIRVSDCYKSGSRPIAGTYKGEQCPSDQGRDFRLVCRHEFGHLLGLWDTYSYSSHMEVIPFWGKRFGEWLVPYSGNKTSGTIMGSGGYISPVEYEMILWAGKRNRLQNHGGGFLGNLFGEVSQYYYYN